MILMLIAVFFTVFFTAKSIFPLKYKDVITENAGKYGMDPYLVMAVIRTESNFKESAVSSADAIGLMQITEETGQYIAGNLGYADFSKNTLYNAEKNIEFGTWYINWLMEMYPNNLENVLAAYNAGFNNVNKWLSDEKYSSDGKTLDKIPYRETENFVNRAELYRSIYRILY